MRTDYQSVEVEPKGYIALQTMNNPPVNQLSQGVKADLKDP